MRRSSRSIGANLAEAWSKRTYSAHFLSKLSDSDGELQETLHWIATAGSCGYLKSDDLRRFESSYAKVGRMLGSMIAKYQTFCLR